MLCARGAGRSGDGCRAEPSSALRRYGKLRGVPRRWVIAAGRAVSCRRPHQRSRAWQVWLNSRGGSSDRIASYYRRRRRHRGPDIPVRGFSKLCVCARAPVRPSGTYHTTKKTIPQSCTYIEASTTRSGTTNYYNTSTYTGTVSRVKSVAMYIVCRPYTGRWNRRRVFERFPSTVALGRGKPLHVVISEYIMILCTPDNRRIRRHGNLQCDISVTSLYSDLRAAAGLKCACLVMFWF